MLIKKVTEKQIENDIMEALIAQSCELSYQFEKIAIDEDGYANDKVFGRTIVEKGTSDVDRLEFYLSNIVKVLNSHKIYEQAFLDEIAKCFTEFIVLHELKHVEQFRKGMIYEEYCKQQYEENVYEKEANEYALNIIRAKGDYFDWLLQFVPWKSKGAVLIYDENREEIQLNYKKMKKK